MRTYDVKCPICGKVNRGLYLEEAEGWMECDQCRNATKVQLTDEYKLLPVCVVKPLNRCLLRFDTYKENMDGSFRR